MTIMRTIQGTGTVDVLNGQSDIRGLEFPANIWVTPIAGGSMKIENSVDGGVTWTAWPTGTVTAHTEQVLYAPPGQLRATVVSGASGMWGIA